MQKFYTGIVNKRKLIIVLFMVAFIISLFCSKLVSVNYDITDYLPENTKSTVSIDVMQAEFDGGIPNARVMIKNVTIPEALELYEQTMAQIGESYDRLAAMLKQKHTETLMAGGMEEKAAARKAEKMAIEDARFVLPNACDTQMVVTMNARSLYNFFRHRCCARAQWEIRELAEAMLRLVRQVAPNLFAHSGPSCGAGPCPEGKMTCGRAAEMRERYAPEQERKDG